MKLKNTVLIVNNLEQSKKFYKQVLGLKVLLDFHGQSHCHLVSFFNQKKSGKISFTKLIKIL